MVRLLSLVAIVACSAPPKPSSPPAAPTPAPPGDPLEIATPEAPSPVPPPPVAPPAGTVQVVVIASGAGSRTPTSPRALRRLIAAKQGVIEIAKGYGTVGLTITKIESGTLDDPSYATRPVGTNHLEVVLLDEAAFASDPSLAGFGGRWTLTRMPDGQLYVSAITDTPYSAKAATTRRALIDQARIGLHGGPDQRLAALEILDEHPFLQLMPDVIALLDDQRTGNANAKPVAPGGGRRGMGPRIVGDAADATLRKMVEPWSSGREPKDRDVASWRLYWRGVLAGEPIRERLVSGSSSTIAEIPMNQSWPELVALPDGWFAFGISRMEKALDGHIEGLAVTAPPYQTRIWFGTDDREELDAAIGPKGAIGLLSADGADHWNFSLVQQGKATPPIQMITKAKHAALAGSPAGYLAVFIRDGERMVHAQAIDAAGRPRGPVKDIALPAEPAAWYHRGFHAIKVARRGDGWLVALEIRGGVLAISLDDKLALVGTPTELAKSSDFTQPKLAMGPNRAFVAWTQGRFGNGRVGHAMVKYDGTMIGKAQMVGDEVWDVSKPVALDDGGFALAWIEAEDEVHLGRWNAAGDFVASVIVVPHDAAFLTLALGRDKGQLVVGYQDLRLYPYKLVAVRIDPAEIK
jgi:hypothetical protein